MTDTRQTTTETARDNVRVIYGMEERAAARRTWGQRTSDRVLAIVSRESTLALHAAVFVIWIAANTGLFGLRPFDPFPYALLTMLACLEAVLLALLVLASQMRLRQDADRRAHLDLQVSLLAEQEMTLVLQMLKEICQHLGLRETVQSRKFQELAQRTDIGELAEHLERVLGDDAGAAKPKPGE